MSGDTAVRFAGIDLRNPILTASGTSGYGSEFAPFLDFDRIGGIVAKSLTLEPRQGNPPARIAEAPAGMLNAIGLENVGVDAFVTEKLPLLPPTLPVIASVFETEIDRYAEVCKRLSGVPQVAGLEVNASCPHVKSGGIEFGQRPSLLAELVRATRRAADAPLVVKLSPNVTDIAEMARVCEGEGADGIALINTLQALEIDLHTRRSVLRNGLGGLSGPAIRVVAQRMVWQASRAVSIPVCGIGGIQTGEDALKFLVCGATAVQVGTANYLDPQASQRIADETAALAARLGNPVLREWIGTLEFPGG